MRIDTSAPDQKIARYLDKALQIAVETAAITAMQIDRERIRKQLTASKLTGDVIPLEDVLSIIGNEIVVEGASLADILPNMRDVV
jgi:hypothetical protein